jgi:hypothetical protein
MHFRYFVPLIAASLLVQSASLVAQPVRAEDKTAQSSDSTAVSAPRLIIDSTAACTLKINGKPEERALMPGKPRTVDVAPGTATVECTSTTVPGASVSQAYTIPRAGTFAVTLDVATPVVKASCKGQAATLADLGHGVLRHCVTGVDWTQRDSGVGGMFWADAFEYCAKMGKGWLLPGLDDLAELIDRTGKSQTSCGIHTCNISPHFRLTSPLFWSSLKTHEGMHMIVNLILGGRHPTADDENHQYHTLCIRPPTGS